MILYLFLFSFVFNISTHYDLTIEGHISFHEAHGRTPISIIDSLADDIKINIRPMNNIGIFNHNAINYSDMPNKVMRLIKNHSNFSIGNIYLYTGLLWLPGFNLVSELSDSKIKLAYAMAETSRIPKEWTVILNNQFDAVIVPDKFVADTYKASGVKIPIFILPHILYLDKFLKSPIKNKQNKPFVFGCSALCRHGKNQELLLDAFYKAFKNSKDVILKLHTRGILDHGILENLKNKIAQYNSGNIELLYKVLDDQEQLEWMKSLDCYVLLSKGEGFSFSPREAMALGLPCIISNNTAHKTICDSGLVSGINCPYVEPAYYDFFQQYCGDQYNCDISDVVLSLKDVYENYHNYLKSAAKRRDWVLQYKAENLKSRYLSLFKPKKVILGKENRISSAYLMTNSNQLYEKYLELLKPI